MKTYIQFIYEGMVSDEESIGATKQISEEAFKKFRNALHQVCLKYPWFYYILIKLKIREENISVPTMGVDGISLFYNANFVNGLEISDIIYILCHEAMHVACCHMTRMLDKDHDLANRAMDYAINLLLDFIKSPAPAGGCYDKKYENMSAEEIYELLTKDQKGGGGAGKSGAGTPGSGTPGSGTPGTGGPSSSKNFPGGGTDLGQVCAPGTLQGGKDVFKKLREGGLENLGEGDKKIEEAAKQGTGSIDKTWKNTIRNAGSSHCPGVDRFVKNELEGKISWLGVFKKIFRDDMITKKHKFQLGHVRKNWKAMGPGGYIPQVFIPEKESHLTGVVVMDTSGSIGDDEIEQFAAEIQSICKQLEMKNLYAIYCDDIVQNWDSFKKPKTSKPWLHLKPKGRGGTSLKEPFDWMKKNPEGISGLIPKKIDFVLYFTDSYGTMPSLADVAPYKYLFWIIITDATNTNAKSLPVAHDGGKIYIGGPEVVYERGKCHGSPSNED